MSAALEGLVMPSGAIDAAERETVAWLYNGNLASGIPVPVAAATYWHDIGYWPRTAVGLESKRPVRRIGR